VESTNKSDTSKQQGQMERNQNYSENT